MTWHRARHLLVQTLRHVSQLAVLGLVFALVYLSLYAHYRASRAIEDEQFLKDFNGRMMVRIDQHLGSLNDPDALLDGYKGTLWSMRVAGVELTDPLAAAEMIATSKTIHTPLMWSILIPVVVTLSLGRVFCSWMCPAGLLFEITDKLRRLLRLAEIKPGDVKFSHRNKYAVLVVGLIIGAIVGLPFFALVYPPAMISRMAHGLVFGTAITGMLVILSVMIAMEVFVSPRWWCRTMCPGGALYGLLGWKRLLRVRLDAKACTGCRDCEPACPLGLNPVTQSATIECDNCGVCLHHCQDKALFYAITVSAKPARRKTKGERRRATAAVVALLVVLLPNAARGHHILGLPHYAYKENYPQAPTLEYPATTGPYDVLMTSYPGQPLPGEAANITFYIKNRDSGDVYEQPINVRVLQTFTLGGNRTIVPASDVEAFDKTHKLSVTFPEDGEFIVELTMNVEGQPEVIPFLMVAGEPSATKSILAAIGAALVVFIVVIRAIKIKKARRLSQGDKPCLA